MQVLLTVLLALATVSFLNPFLLLLSSRVGWLLLSLLMQQHITERHLDSDDIAEVRERIDYIVLMEVHWQVGNDKHAAVNSFFLRIVHSLKGATKNKHTHTHTVTKP